LWNWQHTSGIHTCRWFGNKGTLRKMQSRPRVNFEPRLSDELGPAVCIIATVAIFLGGSYYALFDLSKPTAYPNPGVESYHLPAATRILPLPRVSDAPAIAIEPAPSGGESASTALAQASTPAPAKDAAAPSHKATHPTPESDPRAAQAWSSFGYAPQWDTHQWDTRRGSANSGSAFAHDPPARPRTSGGPKSSF
jgi:hypothetical protein